MKGMNYNLFENCSCPNKPLEHTVDCLAIHLRVMHQQLASTATQIEQSLEAMDHIGSSQEKAIADNLFEVYNAVAATLPELSGLGTSNTVLFVVVVAALNHAQAALLVYFKSWEGNLTAAKAAHLLSSTSTHLH
jgi:hypothetical protein